MQIGNLAGITHCVLFCSCFMPERLVLAVILHWQGPRTVLSSQYFTTHSDYAQLYIMRLIRLMAACSGWYCTTRILKPNTPSCIERWGKNATTQFTFSPFSYELF